MSEAVLERLVGGFLELDFLFVALQNLSIIIWSGGVRECWSNDSFIFFTHLV